MNEATTTQQDVVLKIPQLETDYHVLIADVIFNADFFLRNLSQEENLKVNLIW